MKTITIATILLALSAPAFASSYCNDQSGKPLNAAACADYQQYSASLPTPTSHDPLFFRLAVGNNGVLSAN